MAHKTDTPKPLAPPNPRLPVYRTLEERIEAEPNESTWACAAAVQWARSMFGLGSEEAP